MTDLTVLSKTVGALRWRLVDPGSDVKWVGVSTFYTGIKAKDSLRTVVKGSRMKVIAVGFWVESKACLVNLRESP